MSDNEHVVEQLISAPAGAVLVAALELEERTDAWWGDWSGDSNPDAVNRAAERMAARTFTEICHHLLMSTFELCPWVPGAEETGERALATAKRRRPIAEALITHHGDKLEAGLDTSLGQELWISTDSGCQPPTPFAPASPVYGDGQFAWSSLPTTTQYDSDLLDAKVWVTDFNDGDFERWRLTVGQDVRTYELRSFEDWHRLVGRYPAHRSDGNRAPDWDAIAADFDAVHLTWLGLLTAHYNSVAAQEAGVITLNFWFDEETRWLHNCFTAAETREKSIGPTAEWLLAELGLS